jgi:hypothetical protein
MVAPQAVQDKRAAVCIINVAEKFMPYGGSQLQEAGWSGTGFHFGNGWVITNSHVAGDALSLAAAKFTFTEFPDPAGQEVEGSRPCLTLQPSSRVAVIFHIPDQAELSQLDIALVYCPELTALARPLPTLATPDSPTLQEVGQGYCLHHAGGNPALQCDEIRSEGGIKFIPALAGGSSGGPLLTHDGKLMGINFAGTADWNAAVRGNIRKIVGDKVILSAINAICGSGNALLSRSLSDLPLEEGIGILARAVEEAGTKGMPIKLCVPNFKIRHLLRKLNVPLA